MKNFINSQLFLKLCLIFFLILLGFVSTGYAFYFQSEQFKKKADLLVRQNNPEDAIPLYERAHKLFPFRNDVVFDISKAKYISQQNLISEDKNQADAEVQAQVPVSPIPIVPIVSPTPVTVVKPVSIAIPILMYHHIRINPQPRDSLWASLHVSPQQFEEQLKYLADHQYHPVSLNEIYGSLNGEGRLPEKPVVLTFDDGYRSFYDNAYPLLVKYHMKAVEFVITNVQQLPAYFTWEQAQTMNASGLIEFGAHTRNHPALTTVSQNDLVSEIKGSKNDLESHLKKTITWFAYPYGDYNTRVVNAVRDAGYIGAVTTNFGSVETMNTLYLLPRIMVDGRYSIKNFATRLE